MFPSRPRFLSTFAFCLMFGAHVLPCLAQEEDPGDGGANDAQIQNEELPVGEMPDEPPATMGGVYTKANWPLELINRPISLAGVRTRSEVLFAGMLEIGSTQPLVFSPPSFTNKGIPGPLRKETIADMFVEYGHQDKLDIIMGDHFTRFGSLVSKNNPAPGEYADEVFPLVVGNRTILTTYEEPVEGVGDDLYMRSTSHIYVSRDRLNWKIDSTGLGSLYFYSLAMDSGQSVYVATNKGSFRQAPKGDVWEKASGFPEVYTSKIYIDRSDRFFLSTDNGVFASTDGGATFHLDSAGMGRKTPLGYGDDAFGNVYALVSPNRVYRSKLGTQPWEAVGGGLELLADVLEGQPTLNTIFGDTTLVLCTAVGPYSSTDQGLTWVEGKGKFRDPSLGKILLAKDGSLYASHARGLFRRKSGESAWTKVFPETGFLPNRPLFEDSAGRMYTLGKKIPGQYIQMPMIRAGASGPWVPDTAGISVVTAFNTLLGRDGFYFVDGSGGQHIADVWTGTAAKIWSKLPGGAWALDTAGLGAVSGTSSSQPTAWGTDNAGYLYMALATVGGIVVRRPIAGGAWAIDSAGLEGANLYVFASGKDGRLWAGGIGGLRYRDNGKWVKAGVPKPAMASSAVFALTVDGDGTVFAGYSDFQFLTNKSLGVYATEDGGKIWNALGMMHVTPRSLYVGQGKVYGTTYGLGVYGLDKAKPLAARIGPAKNLPARSAFRVLANPFSLRKVVAMDLTAAQAVKVEVVNLKGRIIRTVAHKTFPIGASTVAFDAGFLDEGIYFLRIETAQADRAILKFIR